MKKYFIWIVSDGGQNSFKKRGLSPHYIIPKGMTNGLENQLANSNIWLVVRGKHDTVFAYITSKRIEKFLDGINQGDFLLSVNMKDSFKITDRNDISSNYSLAELKSYSVGLNSAPTELNNLLIVHVVSKIQTRLQSPKKLLGSIKFDEKVTNINLVAKKAVNTILQNFCLDDLWASQMGIVLTPVANFSHALIGQNLGIVVAEKLLPILTTLDPISRFKVEPNSRVEESNLKETFQIVDTEFTEIEPDTIYAREFIGTTDKIFDIEAALAKTEAAEEIHQQMLRDVCLFLRTQKIIPFESESVDLMFEISSKTIVVEIKSTNDTNLIAQCSKGAFQLSYYLHALSKDFENLNPVLIIRKTNNTIQQNICLEVLAKLNIKCLVYDPLRDWPERVPELLVHVGLLK